MRSFQLALSCALLVGCTQSSTPSALDACPGSAAPALSECERGLFHADCGGEGEPVLACGPGCRWFQGGCPAEGYVPIDCPVGDPFCVETGDGRWPFEDERVFDPGDWYVDDSYYGSIFCDHLALIGDAVVTPHSDMVLSVTIDPDLAIASSPAAECSGVDLVMCRTTMPLSIDSPVVADASATTVVTVRATALGGDAVSLEIGTDAAGGLAGRAFALQDTDFWPYGLDCEAYVSRFESTGGPRPEFVAGEIVLSAEPGTTADVHGVATLRTAAGGALTLAF